LKRPKGDPAERDSIRNPSDYLREGGWSDDFAFIAGFTSAGFPFGTTWEEMEEMEKREAEIAAMRQEQSKRTIHVNMNDLEPAFEWRDNPFSYFLDTESGNCVVLPGYGYDAEMAEEMKAEVELVESAPPGRFLPLGSRYDPDLRPSIDEAREFVVDVDNERFRARLHGALGQRRGAFRRFLDVLHEEAGEVEHWHHFRRLRLRENIAAYLAAEGLSVTYDALPPFQRRNESRRHLLEGPAAFVDRVKRIHGVERIALIGSLASSKSEPNDVDLLLTIATRNIVPQIAAAGRKLKGHAQRINRGADVFLADSDGAYLGRTCPWRECEPGLRIGCEAQHCGTYLYDDLQVVELSQQMVASPPLEIWPAVVVRQDIPADVLKAFGIAR